MSTLREKYRSITKKVMAGPSKYGTLQRPDFLIKPTLTYVMLYWINFISLKHFSLVGRALFFLSCFILTYSLLDPLRMPVSQLSFSLVAFFVISLCASFILRPNVKLKRNLPFSANANSSLKVSYSLENLRRFANWDLLIDSLPYKNTSFPDGVAYIEELRAKETVQLNVTMTISKRGPYVLPTSNIASCFPFGLMKWTLFGEGNNEILILPELLYVDKIQFNQKAQAQLASSTAFSKGGNEDFHGCREYHVGDNIKHLHWASWARTGQPVIKEFSEQGQSKITLFLDLDFKTLKTDKYRKVNSNYYEKAISLFAGIITYLSRQNYLFRHLIINNNSIDLSDTTNASIAAEHIIHELALIDAEDDQTWYTEDTLSHFSGEDCGLCLFVD